jgi:hypothetical protein
MTTALCTGCGSIKFGAWLACKTCGVSSTGDHNLDIFMSDHYLDEKSLAFLAAVVTRIRGVVGDPAAVQQLFTYYAVQRLPGLGKVEIDPGQRIQIEAVLERAGVPQIPADLVFRFDETLEKRTKGPWWRFWK